jgi:hypothetical protein
MATITGPSIQKRIAKAKRQVLADIRSGLVPEDIASFQGLHDHVDANCYGDLIDSWVHDGDVDGEFAHWAVANEVQGAVDKWLLARMLRRTAPRRGPTKREVGDRVALAIRQISHDARVGIVPRTAKTMDEFADALGGGWDKREQAIRELEAVDYGDLSEWAADGQTYGDVAAWNAAVVKVQEGYLAWLAGGRK